MRIIPLIITLLVASPVFGQSRVYTNADLGKPLSQANTVTPAEAVAVFTSNTAPYVAPPPAGTGPQVYVMSYDQWWPFDGPQRMIQPLAPPWRMTTYVGRQRYPARDSGIGMRVGGHLLPPKGKPGAIRRPQPERRATPATASRASWPDRRASPRD